MAVGGGTHPSIHVLAGPNGAGKSSVAGASLRARGGEYYNPDEVSRTLLDEDPGSSTGDANSRAWRLGVRLLGEAIDERRNFAFETTLGGSTITDMLARANTAGSAVRMHYVALGTIDLHVARVRARVARGGHDIPEALIRARYVRSMENLIRLLPHLTELVVWDNSEEGDPERGVAPAPLRILHYLDGALVDACPPAEVPDWAKPIYMAVYERAGDGG